MNVRQICPTVASIASPPILSSTMLKKRRIRELAMQILFLWDSQDSADKALADQVVMDGTDDAEVRKSAAGDGGGDLGAADDD